MSQPTTKNGRAAAGRNGHDNIPTAEAARIALRTQQILAYESGVANTVDPLGGSYFVEKFTLDMEKGAFDYFDKLDVKRVERHHIRRLEQLGYTVTLTPNQGA